MGDNIMSDRAILESNVRSDACRPHATFQERVDTATMHIHMGLLQGDFKVAVYQQLMGAMQDAYLRGYKAAEGVKRKRKSPSKPLRSR